MNNFSFDLHLFQESQNIWYTFKGPFVFRWFQVSQIILILTISVCDLLEKLADVSWYEQAPEKGS